MIEMKKFIFLLIFSLFLLSSLPLSEARCEGSVIMILHPSLAKSGEKVKAIIAGLKDCEGKLIHVKRDNCTGPEACACECLGSGCSCTFEAPPTKTSKYGFHRYFFSEYRYYACVDKNDDGDFDDKGEVGSFTLKVRRDFKSITLSILNTLKTLIKGVQNILSKFLGEERW